MNFSWTQLVSDLRVFFVTIAVLLGIGILSLPVTLVYSGFLPFLAIFTFVFVMQLCTIVLQTDNMQRAQQLLIAQRSSRVDSLFPQPDLHSMSQLFLARGAAVAFDASVIVTFGSTLISYALAGAAAFAEVFSTQVESTIIPFVLSCVVIIVFFSRIAQPIIGALTSVKVTLLCFIIGAVGLVSHQVHQTPSSSWSTVMQPFLIGTVAIGGIADTMPVMISGAALMNRVGVVHFRWSLVAGVAACYILNVLWALFVLHIVPQTEADAVARQWPADLSLEYAASNGQISTIPVTKVIDLYFPAYSWVARLVTAFIVLSICVSFNAIGIALKHALDGLAVSLLRVAAPYLGISPAEKEALLDLLPSDVRTAPQNQGDSRTARCRAACDFRAAWSAAKVGLHALLTQRSLKLMLIGRGTLYVLCFGVVLAVALANPSGFLIVLSVFTSMSLNFAGGVFVAMMFWGARKKKRLAVEPQQPHKTDVLDAQSVENNSDPAGTLAQPGKSESCSPLLSKFQYQASNENPVQVARLQVSATGGRNLFGEFDNIAVPVDEFFGQSCAVFVCFCFALAIIYDVWSSSQAPVGRVWSDAFGALACILFYYHVLLPTASWTPLATQNSGMQGINASAARLSGPRGGSIAPDSDPPTVDEEGEGELTAMFPQKSQRASTSSLKDASPYVRWNSLLPFDTQCEIVDFGLWILYGVHPAAGWSVAFPIVVTVIHFCILALRGRCVDPRSTAFRALPLASTILDISVVVIWACLQFLSSDGFLGGGLAVALAVFLVGAAALRRCLLLESVLDQ